jgi:hypothetical protein
MDVAIKAKMTEPPIGVAYFSIAIAQWNPLGVHKVQDTDSDSSPLGWQAPPMLSLLPKPSLTTIAGIGALCFGPYMVQETQTGRDLWNWATKQAWQSMAGNSPSLRDRDAPIDAPPGQFVSTSPFGTPPPASSDGRQRSEPSGTVSQASPETQASPATPGPATIDLRAWLRWDLPRGYLLWQHPNAAIVPTERNLLGYRFPFTTGLQPQDLTGTLTYYYDAKDQLQRMELSAASENPWPMTQWLLPHFRLQPIAPLQPNFRLAILKSRDKTQSLLAVATGNASSARPPHELFLELNRSTDLGLGFYSSQLLQPASNP